MKQSQSQLIWGILLIAGGIFFLLQSLGFLTFGMLSSLFWSTMFGLGGLAFFVVFSRNREHWWSLIPAFVLLSIGALILLGWMMPRVASAVGGSLFLGGMSLGFWLIYLNDRQHWWAVIPGGVLLTLAAVAGLDNIPGFRGGGAIFFLGLSATFGFLALLPIESGERMRWPVIPALVCLVLAVMTSTVMTSVLNFIWPLALIGFGLYLLLRPKQAASESAEKSPPKGEGVS
jgi:hypothetical protein